MKAKQIRTNQLFDFVLGCNRHDILIPDFQRKVVWEEPQRQTWAETIRGDRIIPCFILGRYSNDTKSWICDGVQRLQATLSILKTPEKYGFSNKKDAVQAVKDCSISVQTIVFDSREEAYECFILINSSGTALTMAELYKGDLVNAATRPLGEAVHENAARWLDIGETVCEYKGTNRLSERAAKSVAQRGALALFYQFISGYPGYTFWNYALGKPASKPKKARPDWKPKPSVESLLAAHLIPLSTPELDAAIASYTLFVANWKSFIRTVLDNRRQKSTINDGLFRHLLHLAIWCKHNGYPSGYSQDMVRVLISECPENNQKANAKYKEPPYHYLQSDKLNNAFLVLQENGFSLQVGIPAAGNQPRRKKQPRLIAGYDNSHVQPFSVHGEGEVISEPSIINRSRGAAPIDAAG